MVGQRVDGIHHVSLTVADLDRSVEWYERIFRLDRQFDEHGDERRAVIFRLAGTTTSIALVEHHESPGDRFRPQRVGLDHVAFSVPTRDSIEGWAAHLDDHRIEHSGVIDIPPGAILNFRDPDDIQLAIFWDRDPPVG